MRIIINSVSGISLHFATSWYSRDMDRKPFVFIIHDINGHRSVSSASRANIVEGAVRSDFFKILQELDVKKKTLQIAVLVSLLTTLSAFAHHPAEDILDEAIYAMTDLNVADSPHAELDSTDMGN